MATVVQLRDRIKVRLARRTITNLDTIIVDEMTHAQVEILEKEAWLPNFLKHQVDFIITGAHTVINLAAQAEMLGFIRPLTEDETASLAYSPSPGLFTSIKRYDSRDQLEQLFPLTGTTPGGYYWNGVVDGFYVLQPQPTQTTSYCARFYRADPNTPAAPDGNGMTRWTRFAGDYLMHTTGVELATYLRDEPALQYFIGKRQEAFTRLQRQKTAQDMADTDLAMGE